MNTEHIHPPSPLSRGAFFSSFLTAINLEPRKRTFAFKRLAYESCVTYGIKHACENNNIGRNTLRGDFHICARKKCISFCSIFEVEGHHE